MEELNWKLNQAPLPKDPVMLLSVINTALRDHYESLDELVWDNQLDRERLIQTLDMIDYQYESEINQFR